MAQRWLATFIVMLLILASLISTSEGINRGE